MKLYYIVFCILTLLLMQIAGAQQPSTTNLITSSRPLLEAAQKLEEQYGKVITYEEPLLTWQGELQAVPGLDPESRWGGERFATPQSFTMPKIGTDLRSDLDNTLMAYHQATSGTRFQVLSSKLGYHIVPVQMHDENGRSVPTTSLLDQVISISNEARTAEHHLDAISAAISSVQPIRVATEIPFIRPNDFNNAFRAQPPIFQWGVQSITARDALIDLLNQSATTFSWALLCQASTQPRDRYCNLNVGPLEAPTTDSHGNTEKRPIFFDRGR